MPQIEDYVWDANLQAGSGAPASAADLAQGSAGIMRQRTPEEVQSLMDLMNSQTLSSGGFPYSSGDTFNYAGTPAGDPSNWRLSRADAESPLAYMSQGSGGIVGGPPWRPNDQGGYFTLDQLYGVGRGGQVPGGGAGGGMSFRSSAPSTNNWRLTLPFGGGPGAIMRNGMVIFPGENTSYGLQGGAGGASLGASGEQTMPGVREKLFPFSGGGKGMGGAAFWPGGAPWGHTFGRPGAYE